MHNFTLFTFVVLGFIASISLAASAAPPACVLACVNKEQKPGDLAAVCASSSVGTCLNTQCNGYKDQAIQAFKTTCTASGHDAAVGSSSSSESSSMTKTGSFSGKTSEASASGTTISSFASGSASGSMPTGSGTHASNSSKPTSPSSPTGTQPASSDGTHVILSSLLCILAVAVSAATL